MCLRNSYNFYLQFPRFFILKNPVIGGLVQCKYLVLSTETAPAFMFSPAQPSHDPFLRRCLVINSSRLRTSYGDDRLTDIFIISKLLS